MEVENIVGYESWIEVGWTYYPLVTHYKFHIICNNYNDVLLSFSEKFIKRWFSRAMQAAYQDSVLGAVNP